MGWSGRWRGAVLLGLTLCAAERVSGQAADPFDPAKLPALQTSEVVRLGGYDERPAFTFSSVPAGAVLSEQQIALVDRQSNQVRLFDLSGNHLRSFGGSGDGPGEFKFLSAIQPLPGGRLVAWDFQTKRISVFDPDGAHLRTMTVRVQPMALAWTQFVGAFPDGSVVLRSDPSVMALRNEPDGYRRESTDFLRYSPDQDRPDTLCAVQGPEKYLYHQDRSWDLEDRLFEREVVGAVMGDTLLCGSTASLDLRRVSMSDPELSNLAYDRPARGVSDAEVEQERKRLIDQAKARQERRGRAMAQALGAFAGGGSVELDRLSRKEAYETRPAFRSIRAGSDGELWIEDYPSPTDSQVRWILLVEGEPVGWLEVGAQETVLAFGHGLLLKRVQDELDVQSVVVQHVAAPKPN